MTTPAVTANEPTPPQVAETAKIADALPLDQLVLIGIFGKPSGNTALLRQADGSMVTVATGDSTSGVRIAAIDDDALHLVDASGTAHVLTIPAG